MLQHRKDPILEVLVKIDGQHVTELESENGRVKMIPFVGNVQGPLFSGIVEPYGVDTQMTNAAGVCHMSARYMLSGRDNNGEECRIFVENNAWQPEGEWPSSFRTIPTFVTDSRSLAPYLHSTRFVGEGETDERGFWIRFYELENGQG